MTFSDMEMKAVRTAFRELNRVRREARRNNMPAVARDYATVLIGLARIASEIRKIYG